MAHPVIVGVDDPATAGDAVDWAADEAELRDVRLHLVHAWVWEADQAPDSLNAPSLRRSGEDMLDALAKRARKRHPGLTVTSGVVDVRAREALVALSAAAGPLVLGARGAGGFAGLLVGSTSLHVAAHAGSPVVIVRGTGAAEGGVVVGVDGRDSSDALLSYAFEAAQRRKVPLHVIHAWSYPLVLGPGHEVPPVYEESHVAAEEGRLLSEILAGWREEYPDLPLSEDTVRSGPARHLVTQSKKHQLVVVGRHGELRGPFQRLGSVSQAVVSHAHCPVAVVPIG
ncbi:universal stress protein [Kitasatospora sp. NPDC050543]|uniref:universal stress protein n=1 Tax=Kitasatospora sp. NPDC050543 TaxID=3364054 RepID=UPI003797D0A4